MSDGSGASVGGEVVKIVPQILWILLALYAFHTLYEPLLAYVDRGKISEVNVWNIQIKFARQSLARDDTKTGSIKTPEEFAPFEERIKRLAPKIVGASILWVDDKHPTKNLFERKAFSALGINIDMVKDTDEALKMLSLTSYDVVISDMSRSTQPDNDTDCGNSVRGAGCGLLKSMHAKLGSKQPPTIIYLSSYNEELGTPAHAFGVTNRTDYLLQYVLDAVERRGVSQ